MPRHNHPPRRHRHTLAFVRAQDKRHTRKRLRTYRELGVISHEKNMTYIDRMLARADKAAQTGTPYPLYSRGPLPSYVTRSRNERLLADLAGEQLGQAGPVYFFDIGFLRSAPLHLLRAAGGDLCLHLTDRSPRRWWFRCGCDCCLPQGNPGYRSRLRRQWQREVAEELNRYCEEREERPD